MHRQPMRPRVIFSLSHIPTLSQLYNQPATFTLGLVTSPLEPIPSSNPLRPHSESINRRISLIQGDITALRVDAIVNATNTTLRPGGGVDAAIHMGAGRSLRGDLEAMQGCRTGQSVITRGYNLPVRHVIHTVGPIYSTRFANGGPADPNDAPLLLASCYRTALDLAVHNGIKTVAFPCISTGLYRYPSVLAAEIACETVRTYVEEHGANEIERVVFCVFENHDAANYERILPKYFPPRPPRAPEQQR